MGDAHVLNEVLDAWSYIVFFKFFIIKISDMVGNEGIRHYISTNDLLSYKLEHSLIRHMNQGLILYPLGEIINNYNHILESSFGGRQ